MKASPSGPWKGRARRRKVLRILPVYVKLRFALPPSACAGRTLMRGIMGEVINMLDWIKGRTAEEKPTVTILRNAEPFDGDGNYLASAVPIFETRAGERVTVTGESAFWDAVGLPLNR